MKCPIAVFDSGIGSYYIVNSIRKTAPKQDIIYLADRASFPYGEKNPDELKHAISRSVLFLQNKYNPQAVIVASNAPSVIILHTLKKLFSVPLYGIFPPVSDALDISHTKNIGILCVKSLADNQAIFSYVKESAGNKGTVNIINASELVQKVESGEFIFDYEGTKKIVRLFLDKVLHKNPEIDTFTLSSTHLPWLSPFFTELYPKISFIDPADKTVASLPLNNLGTGQILGIVTEGKDHDYSQKNFRKILNRLGIEIPLQFLSF
jgi:glutamate racemase